MPIYTEDTWNYKRNIYISKDLRFRRLFTTGYMKQIIIKFWQSVYVK
jgi:hypothetical protein